MKKYKYFFRRMKMSLSELERFKEWPNFNEEYIDRLIFKAKDVIEIKSF